MSQANPDIPSPLVPVLGAHPSARRWLITWAIVVVALVALLSFEGKLDQILWSATQQAAGNKTRFNRLTSNLWIVFKAFGEPWMLLLIALFLAVYDRRHWLTAGGFGIATALAGGLSWLIRSIDGRYRPTHIDGASQWELFRGFHDGRDLAFPSGHATAAFAAAAVLAYVSPKGRWFFGAVAAGTALSRVIAGAHFYSDILLGAALGWTVSWFTIGYLDRLATRAENRRRT